MQRAIRIGALLKEAARGWNAHRAQSLGAALAFYTTLALAPLTLIAIAVAGHFFGQEAARGEIVGQIEQFVGREAADVIETLIRKASEPRHSRLATVLGIGLLIFGATTVFAELKDSLDAIWEVKPRPGLGLRTMIKTRLLSFGVVMGTGLLLLVSLLLTATLAAFTRWLPVTEVLAYFFDTMVSFLVITLLFALVFKVLPDVTVGWKDVWIGAVVTGVLFIIGKWLIGLYIRHASVGSIYGAAGSLVVILIWTYYSSQVVFFGAELIRAYADHSGRHVVPTEQAVPVSAGEPVQAVRSLEKPDKEPPSSGDSD